MVYDDIVIGSGLAALATVLGLPKNRKVLVLAGTESPNVNYYDANSGVPCADFGFGGLGAYWHGVIPTGHLQAFTSLSNDTFTEVFNIFYPKEKIAAKLNSSWLFVPYQPVRPANWWPKLLAASSKNLQLIYQLADSIELEGDNKASVISGGQKFSAQRLWLASGALGTPKLLESSPLSKGVSRGCVSDHVISYMGQIDRKKHRHILQPTVERTSSGVWMQGRIDTAYKGLVTMKPARFGYRQLDYGIEQRSAFGLPVKGLIHKMYRAGSLGLIAESLFNKLGLFPNASMQSIYAQIYVKDAYTINSANQKMTPNINTIQDTILNYRDFLNIPELEYSQKSELFIRGIHLHNSLDNEKLIDININTVKSNVAIVDSSVIENIGPEHHSFKVMVAAYSRAQNS